MTQETQTVELRESLAGQCFAAGRINDLLTMEPESTEALYWQALAWLGKDRPRRALVRLRRALEEGSADPRVRALLVRVLAEVASGDVREGRWEQAAAHLQEILEIDSSAATKSPEVVHAVSAVLLMGGQRADAVRLCASLPLGVAAFRRTHFLWLAHYWEGRRNLESARVWQAAIGYMVLLLHDNSWAEWFEYRDTQFGSAGIDGTVRSAVRERLENRSFVPESMGTALRWELEGARALMELGGLPVAGGQRRTLVCGPWMIGQLGLTSHLQSWLASLAGEPDGALRVRRLFSPLGIAQVLLDQNEPEQAWTALAQLQKVPEELQPEADHLKVEIVKAVADSLRARSLDEAIAFLDNEPVFGAVWRELTGKLGSLYHDRGVQRANSKAPNWTECLRDLRRATTLNPHVAFRINLIRALRFRADEVEQSDRGWGRRLRQEALEQGERTLSEFPAEEEIAQECRQLRQDIDRLQSTRYRDDGD